MLVWDHVRDGKAYKNPVLKKSRVEEKKAVLVTYWESLLENTCSKYKNQKWNCEIMVFGQVRKSNILIKNPLFRFNFFLIPLVT